METDMPNTGIANVASSPTAQPTGTAVNPVASSPTPSQPSSHVTSQNLNQSPPPSQPPQVAETVTAEKKSSNFTIFLIISLIIIFIIWGFVAYLYFQNQSLGG